MKFVTPSLVIEQDDGFKNDVLQRKYFGEALSNMVTRTTDDLVISIDGQWGEGKTTFVKMWQGLLKENGVPSIYIDAFQNDYTDDAFISIASSINTYVEQYAPETEAKAHFSDKAKKVGIRLLSWSAKIGIKAATLGAIKGSDIEALSEIGSDIASDTSESISALIQERLSSHTKESELIQSFKESLSEIPNAIKENRSGRLVIIIDELDRCRPSFAVEILEKIKHFFSVKNVVFVLVMHKSQLEEAIKSVYGENIDAHTYLHKFINIETSLPKRLNSYHGHDISAYINRLLQLHELELWGDEHHIHDSLKPIGQHFNLSLRQLEKVFTNLAIIYSTSEKNHLRLVPIITFVSTLKVVNPGLFKKVSQGRISYTELSSAIGLSNEDESNMDTALSWMMNWVRYTILSDQEYEAIDGTDKINKLGQAHWQYNIERKRIIQMFCEKLCLFKIS
ncbi:KAP family P-loop NTPase fold protein [Aeromonas enteropelogenes]|uniref:KAP family P-loop NTPase fold protein n=1 Tax=Aeromonas enteropelogenes TaxID=29489 RepID=UPI003985B639